MFRFLHILLLSFSILIRHDSVAVEENNVTDNNNNSILKPSENIKDDNNGIKIDLKESTKKDVKNVSDIDQEKRPTIDDSNSNVNSPIISNSSNSNSLADISINNTLTPSNDTDTSSSVRNEENISLDEIPQTNTDDIPTFIEYQQMIEKESKQKREKSDSIPNSHTMKGSVEVSSSHTVGDHPESSVSSSSSASLSSKTQDTQDILENNRKSEDLKVELTTSILSKSLMKNNVAAKECGAKILEISNQISHAGFVLNNNKDEYMNMPCSATEKWFIFETCEPVQIRSIQIANFEMFSSRPKTFKVMTTDRYPAKYWYNLGVFRAHDEKGIQTFDVSDTRMVKYLKFEMVDHYGNEHYCPLTYVRVMGNVVIDDMDEELEEDQPTIGENNESHKEVPSKADSDGLLTKAKDIIVKIVNGIGGSSKPDLKINGSEVDKSKELEIKNEIIWVEESPCYFFEFIMKNFRNYFQNIWLNFQRFMTLEKHLSINNSDDIHLIIMQKPYPFQVRVEYLSLLDWVKKTDFSFFRLYQSFLNSSMHCSDNCFSENPLKNLTAIFKCNFYQYPSSGYYKPFLPNASVHSLFNQTPLDNSSSNIMIPNVTISNVEAIGENIVTPPKQYDPTLPGNGDVVSTANHPSITADSANSDDLNKEKTEDVSSELFQDNKTSSPTKDIKSENHEPFLMDNQKNVQSKYKTDDIFDNKMFASPGSNAWNYAFMRIKNIAKELEVNVTISMKYLEELSQNYKLQTDKLKKAQQVMAANVTRLENMINQHRQETKLYIKELKVQLNAILIRMSLGRKISSTSMNLSSMDKENPSECIELIAEDLTLLTPSFYESYTFIIILNIFLPLLCNSLFFAIFYNKMKNSILNDVEKKFNSFQKSYEHTEEITFSTPKKRGLPIDHGSHGSPYPIVMPPRGVRISTLPEFDYLSDDDNNNLLRRQMYFGPHFYPVQPNVNFVTPTKDRKKKKRK